MGANQSTDSINTEKSAIVRSDELWDGDAAGYLRRACNIAGQSLTAVSNAAWGSPVLKIITGIAATVSFVAASYAEYIIWFFNIVATSQKPIHAPESADGYLCPDFLTPKSQINIGIMGNSGVGKSTLCNSLRGLTSQDKLKRGYAKTGVVETTQKPQAYCFQIGANESILLWDLPGAGTDLNPLESYIKKFGARYFDVILIVTAGRLSETEKKIYDHLKGFNVPSFVVRNKVDQDVQNAKDDGVGSDETLREIKTRLTDKYGKDRVYAISAKKPNQYDFENLQCDLGVALVQARVPGA